VFAVEDNSLYIGNPKESKQKYLKIINKSGSKHLVFSDSTNEENKFRAFNYTNAGIKSLTLKTILNEHPSENNEEKINLVATNIEHIERQTEWLVRKPTE
jgi:hypothetical protein